jgi:hypothetical protein
VYCVSAFMKKILLLVSFILPLSSQLQAADIIAARADIKTAKSPVNRVALLELYTSEGCSSCPPADRFLSSLKAAGTGDKKLIPLAFHVTYWDYIGWQDRFAKKQYDEHQRELARKNRQTSVYTPQFVLAGEDYRSYASFSEDVNRLTAEKATVDLVLTVKDKPGSDGVDRLQLSLESDISASAIEDIGIYLAVTENNLVSDVKDGENEGERLQHDYVVRQFSGPFFQSKPENRMKMEQTFVLGNDMKREDLSIVAFAENPHTGEVLQAVRLKYQVSEQDNIRHRE